MQTTGGGSGTFQLGETAQAGAGKRGRTQIHRVGAIADERDGAGKAEIADHCAAAHGHVSQGGQGETASDRQRTAGEGQFLNALVVASEFKLTPVNTNGRACEIQSSASLSAMSYHFTPVYLNQAGRLHPGIEQAKSIRSLLGQSVAVQIQGSLSPAAAHHTKLADARYFGVTLQSNGMQLLHSYTCRIGFSLCTSVRKSGAPLQSQVVVCGIAVQIQRGAICHRCPPVAFHGSTNFQRTFAYEKLACQTGGICRQGATARFFKGGAAGSADGVGGIR